MRYLRIYILAFFALLFVNQIEAQEDDREIELTQNNPSVSLRADSIFASMKPIIDSTFLRKETHIKDNFWKRISFQTNLVDWMLTLPNVGMEFDLSKKRTNQRSLFFNIKYNGSTKENHKPKFVFNYMQVRLEYRKYWRAGNIGNERSYPEYKRVNLHKPDPYYQDYKKSSKIPGKKDKDSTYYGFEKLEAIKDSVLNYYDGDPNRSWFYNRREKIGRRISTRTIAQPRNWRAYFIGVYAMADKYSFCFGKKGNQGTGVGMGVSVGWSIPLLPQRHPRQGGLDLDLGLNVGLRMVRNEKYRYDKEFRDYELVKPANGFEVVPFPLVDEVRVALVYRFRSIGHKVDLSLVDKYKAHIDRFEDRRKAKADTIIKKRLEWEEQQTLMLQKQNIINDSLSFWNNYHKRRLKNAWLIAPDTVFSGRDAVLEAELFPDSVKARVDRMKEAKKVAKENDKRKKAAEKVTKKMRAEAEKPEAEKPEAEKPEVEKPEAEKPEAEKPEAEKPEVEKPETEKPETENTEAPPTVEDSGETEKGGDE